MLQYTKEQLAIIHKERLKELLAEAGDVNHLSKMLAVPYHTVRSWDERGRISKDGSLVVHKHPVLGEKGRGFTKQYLRPEAWS